jgi:septal ring factor EnvC (AmiA/AmiB activator)
VTWDRLEDAYRDLWRSYARAAVTALTGLGAVMPDEAAKLRATATEHAACAERLGESWAYGDKLEAKLTKTIDSAQAIHEELMDAQTERDALRAQADDHLAEAASLAAVVQQLDSQVADVADLCRPTRADDVLRLSDTERLQRIAERITAGEDRG